ncbi:hypothetical protein [Paraglaciecola marina]|uniref:hypothetical protein n=1 Tax=Paraglaciecola marina TaxID=2500157 RepID=UPI001061A83B|nr:hypothetical protein [Paraglaciecola marina]
MGSSAILPLFFSSEAMFEQQSLRLDVLSEVKLFLEDPHIYKRGRILHLLGNGVADTKETWFEFYNWCYREFEYLETPLWYKAKYAEYSATKENIKFMSYHEFLQQYWTVEDVVKSSIFISDEGINNYNASDQEIIHWTRLRNKNLCCFTGAVCGGELVGQVGFIMLNNEEHNQMKNGLLDESDIVGTSLDFEGPIYLYIPSVVIKPEFQNRYLLPVMFRHLFNQLVLMPELIDKLQGFIALAYSDDGVAMCKGFNLQFQSQDFTKSKIYTGSLSAMLNSPIGKRIKLKEISKSFQSY